MSIKTTVARVLSIALIGANIFVLSAITLEGARAGSERYESLITCEPRVDSVIGSSTLQWTGYSPESNAYVTGGLFRWDGTNWILVDEETENGSGDSREIIASATAIIQPEATSYIQTGRYTASFWLENPKTDQSRVVSC